MSYALRAEDDRWVEIVGGFVAGDIQYPANWLELATPAEIAAIGAVAIVDDARPSDARILGTELVDINDAPHRRWLTEPFGAAELRGQVEARAARAFAAGYAPSHPDFAGERLQVRDAEDRTNWLTSQASYAAAVAAGAGDVLDATFRTMANRTIIVTYADGLQILLGMAAWGRDIMAVAWAKKDALAAGQSIDIDDGWPE